MTNNKYSPGINRVFYGADDFQEGLIVTMDLFRPNLQKDSGIVFTEIENGLYFVDISFLVEGIYAAIIYENGVKKLMQSYLIKKDSEVAKNFAVFGPNVINTK